MKLCQRGEEEHLTQKWLINLPLRLAPDPRLLLYQKNIFKISEGLIPLERANICIL
jgi:hypothetical protein